MTAGCDAVILYDRPPEPRADRLPDRLSELVRLAVADARRLDRRAYVPKSCEWHRPQPDGRCGVCLAGAVIAGTLADPDWTARNPGIGLEPGDFREDVDRGLSAIAQLGTGDVIHADHSLRQPDLVEESNWPPVPVERAHRSDAAEALRREENHEFDGWAEFDRHLDRMKALADELEREGL